MKSFKLYVVFIYFEQEKRHCKLNKFLANILKYRQHLKVFLVY